MCVCLFKILSRGKLFLRFSWLIKMCRGKINLRNVIKVDILIITKLVKVLKLLRRIQLVRKQIGNWKFQIMNAKQSKWLKYHNRIETQGIPNNNLRNVSPRLCHNCNSYTCQIKKTSKISQDHRKRIINSCCCTWQRNSISRNRSWTNQQ